MMALETVPEIGDKPDELDALLDELASKPTLLSWDIQRLRHGFYRLGALDRRGAARLLHANRTMAARHDDWAEFCLGALVGFFIEDQADSAVLSREKEAVLLSWLGDGASIDNLVERRLALRLLLMASHRPEHLERRVLEATSENLLHQTERWLGLGRRSAGVIDALDIQLIRKLLNAGGGHERRIPSRSAIDFLIELDQKVLRFVDPEGWRRLLLASLVRHLSAGSSLENRDHVDAGEGMSATIRALLERNEKLADVPRLREDLLAAAHSMMTEREATMPFEARFSQA